MDKMSSLFLIFSWIVIIGLSTVYGQTCNSGTIINGICYTLVRLSKTYDEAKAYCVDNDGLLASITDDATQAGIDQLAAANAFPIPEVWVGAKETVSRPEDRVWKWSYDDSTVANQGCYKDSSSNRDLSFQISMTSDTFSVTACSDGCGSYQYRYMGLQNGNQCFCGNAFGSLGNTTGCTVTCPSPSPADIPYCGGQLKNTIIDLQGSFIKWGFEQPNNYNRYQMCVALDMDLETKAVDEYCYKQFRYICEMPNKVNCVGDETGAVKGIYYSGGDTSACYLVSTDAVSNWYVAHDKCLQISGRLVTLNTKMIFEEVKHIIDNIITASSLITSRKLWIGLRRGGWKWETGEVFQYSNWMPEQPDSWQENCVMLSRSNAFMWEDRDCAVNAYFVCQGGNIPVPTTTITTTTGPTTTSTTTTPGPTQTPSAGAQTGGTGLSTEEIILLVIVLVLVVVGVLVFSIIIYYCCKRKSRRVDSTKSSDKRMITGPLSTRSTGSIYSNEFIDINDQSDYYSGSATSYRY